MRFIGFMDVGTINDWRLDEVLPADEILVRISREFLPCSSEPKPNHVGEAAKHGKLYTYLFASDGVDLRDREDDTQLWQHTANVWAEQTDRYSQLRRVC